MAKWNKHSGRVSFNGHTIGNITFLQPWHEFDTVSPCGARHTFGSLTRALAWLVDGDCR
jgi:hypothetical protein